MSKPNCYDCKHRENISWSHHSQCASIKSENRVLVAFGIQMTGRTSFDAIDFNTHGVVNGWCNWPVDFDPVWIDRCNFFEVKE